jgi:hypothetical protein
MFTSGRQQVDIAGGKDDKMSFNSLNYMNYYYYINGWLAYGV